MVLKLLFFNSYGTDIQEKIVELHILKSILLKNTITIKIQLSLANII
jgi:hypothetical protein